MLTCGGFRAIQVFIGSEVFQDRDAYISAAPGVIAQIQDDSLCFI